MGNIRKILGKFLLPNRGWRPKENSYNLPFSIELKENFHIHWQDMRIEMEAKDFGFFYSAMHCAAAAWIDDGMPDRLKRMRRYGWWRGEKDRHFVRDRNKEPGHNFQIFPRTEKGDLIYDNAIQLERQKNGQYHLHWKNFRFEFGKKTFVALRAMFNENSSL